MVNNNNNNQRVLSKGDTSMKKNLEVGIKGIEEAFARKSKNGDKAYLVIKLVLEDHPELENDTAYLNLFFTEKTMENSLNTLVALGFKAQNYKIEDIIDQQYAPSELFQYQPLSRRVAMKQEEYNGQMQWKANYVVGCVEFKEMKVSSEEVKQCHDLNICNNTLQELAKNQTPPAPTKKPETIDEAAQYPETDARNGVPNSAPF